MGEGACAGLPGEFRREGLPSMFHEFSPELFDAVGEDPVDGVYLFASSKRRGDLPFGFVHLYPCLTQEAKTRWRLGGSEPGVNRDDVPRPEHYFETFQCLWNEVGLEIRKVGDSPDDLEPAADHLIETSIEHFRSR